MMMMMTRHRTTGKQVVAEVPHNMTITPCYIPFQAGERAAAADDYNQIWMQDDLRHLVGVPAIVMAQLTMDQTRNNNVNIITAKFFIIVLVPINCDTVITK